MDLDNVVLEMIARGGAAKSAVYEALDSYIDGDRELAKKHLAAADDHLAAAHDSQRQVLAEWSRMRTESVGDKNGGNPATGLNGPLLMHVLDIIMTSMSERNLVERIIELFDKRFPDSCGQESSKL